MEELIELVQLFQKTKFKSNSLRHAIMEPGSQLERLYNGLADGQVQSDADVLVLLPELGNNLERVIKLKNKLKDRLLDVVLLLDFKEPDYADRWRAYIICMRKWTSATVLMARRARLSAVSVLEDLLRNTKRFEFTEITVEVLRALSLHQGLLEGNQHKFGEVEGQLTYYEGIRGAEYSMQRLYLDLVNQFVRQKADKGQITIKASQYASHAASAMKKYDSYEVHLYGHLIQIVYHDSQNDQVAILGSATDALTYFKAKPYLSKMAMQAFYYYQLVASFHLRQYEVCLQITNECMEIFEDGTYNWFKIREILFLVSMHLGHYGDACALCQETMRHEAYTEQPGPIWELWKIFEAWIAFLALTGCLSPVPKLPEFRLHKFLNEVPIFSRDKNGMNIPILVIQFLHYLAAKDYDACIDKVEALAKYRLRYLRGSGTLRSQYFVRMLELLPKCGFVYDTVREKGKIFYTQLQTTPIESSNQNHEIEIIPYEDLWEMVLQNLGVQFKKSLHCPQYP